jgi:hypothetical protein
MKSHNIAASIAGGDKSLLVLALVLAALLSNAHSACAQGEGPYGWPLYFKSPCYDSTPCPPLCGTSVAVTVEDDDMLGGAVYMKVNGGADTQLGTANGSFPSTVNTLQAGWNTIISHDSDPFVEGGNWDSISIYAGPGPTVDSVTLITPHCTDGPPGVGGSFESKWCGVDTAGLYGWGDPSWIEEVPSFSYECDNHTYNGGFDGFSGIFPGVYSTTYRIFSDISDCLAETRWSLAEIAFFCSVQVHQSKWIGPDLDGVTLYGPFNFTHIYTYNYHTLTLTDLQECGAMDTVTCP